MAKGMTYRFTKTSWAYDFFGSTSVSGRLDFPNTEATVQMQKNATAKNNLNINKYT